MPFGTFRRIRRRGRLRQTEVVFVVSTAQGVEQLFARKQDAERYSEGLPGSRVNRYPLRTSLDDAVVIFERRMVVANGENLADLRTRSLRFVEDLGFIPEPADVERFHGDADDWHIAGFGTSEAELDEKMRVAALEHGVRRSVTVAGEGAR